MDDQCRSFLDRHRTTARWLDDIISVLIDRRGKAHVRDIANDLAKSNEARDKNTVEQIITRRLNDFCSDAADFRKDADHDLFERVEPATFRLRSYPERPNILELVRIEFDDPAMQSMWDSFRTAYAKQWKQVNNAKRLAAFVKWMTREQNRADYEHRKAQWAAQDGSLECWLIEPRG